MNRRRLLIVLVGIVLLGLLAAGAYLILRDGGIAGETDGDLPEIGTDFTPTSAATSTLDESAVPVTDVHAYLAWDDGTVVAIRNNGTIVRIAGTQETSLSSTPVTDFASASFSADGSKILVLTGKQPRSTANVFDTAAASWRVIPGTFRDAVWAPTGAMLATLTPDAKTGKTAVSLYDTVAGKTTQTVATLALGDVSVSWPAPGRLVIADRPNARSAGSAWTIDIATKRISVAARSKQGLAARWDPTGTRGIAFQANPSGRGGSLRLMEGGTERASLAFLTIPDKCAFFSLPAGTGSSTIPYVLCGVPADQDGFRRAELPDSWYRRQIFTDDVLVGVNLVSREVEMTIAPPVPADIVDVQVIGETAYYADRASGAVYHAELF